MTARILGRSKQYINKIGALPLIIIAMGILIQSFNPNFFTIVNLTNVLRQIAILAIISFGMTMVIISGGIDLSIGSVMGLISVIAATVIRATGNVFLGFLVGLTAGLIVGGLNGFTVVKTGVHPFVVTLGTMTIIRGMAYIVTGGVQIHSLPQKFIYLANNNLGPFPILTWFTIVVFIITYFILNKTRFGVYIYEIGQREEAVITAGININKYKIMVFALSGMLAGLGGILLTSRVISAQASLGTGYHLQAIGAAVIGGASLGGGRGTTIGTIFGVLIMGILSNGLNLLRVSSFWQQVAIGLTIIIAVVMDSYRQHRK